MVTQQPAKTLICVVGARPNFMKIAPVIRALREHSHSLNVVLIHTGQHYDEAMKAQFFEQLGIPEPDKDLEVGAGSQTEQTAEIMKRFEREVDEYQPVAVLVVGDVTSTLATALVAAKKHIPVIHVEAGLRSRDRQMPEEINRVLTDQLSDRLYITERSAEQNLQAEGISSDRVVFVGNVMIDTLHHNLPHAVKPQQTIPGAQWSIIEQAAGKFCLLTLHRPSNVDHPEILEKLLDAVGAIAQQIPVVFPVHPRTKGKIEAFGFTEKLQLPGIICLEPLGYLQMLGMMAHAKLVMTDSGGVQEETTALGVPCITLRENTERPITISEGSNTIVGRDTEKLKQLVSEILNSGGKQGRIPEYWDGKAAERIAADLIDWLM